MANLRRRTRRAPRRRRTYRRRRRNAGITPFVQSSNPLILSNPRRRRRVRRRNPKTDLGEIMRDIATHGAGGLLGYGVNQFALSRIQNDWVRRIAQIVAATGGAWLMSDLRKGQLGAAFAGATLYPLMADLAMTMGLVQVPTEADLLELSADLEAALEADLEDDELYIDDDEDSIVAW